MMNIFRLYWAATHFVLLLLWSSNVQAQDNTPTHLVQKGETLYKIAVKYKITVDEIKALNPTTIKNNAVNAGALLRLPGGANSAQKKNGNTPSVSVKLDAPKPLADGKPDATKKTSASKNAATAAAPADNRTLQQAVKDIIAEKPTVPANTTNTGKDVEKVQTMSDTSLAKKVTPKPIKHHVAPSETLYSIAKMYNQPISTLQEWNNLADLNVKAGQDIVVDWIMPANEALLAVANKTANIAAAKASAAAPPKPMSVFERKYRGMELDTTSSYRKVSQTGIATWFDDAVAASSSGNMYALHRSAPLRSILRVTNPINKKSVYVMVIERLPNTVNNENITLSLTKSAAQRLGILDDKTIVDCRYYVLK